MFKAQTISVWNLEPLYTVWPSTKVVYCSYLQIK